MKTNTEAKTMRIDAEVKADDVKRASQLLTDWLAGSRPNNITVSNVKLNTRPLTRKGNYGDEKDRFYRVSFDIPHMAVESPELHNFISGCRKSRIEVVKCPAFDGTGIACSADPMLIREPTPMGENSMTDAKWQEFTGCSPWIDIHVTGAARRRELLLSPKA
jgi:hypothetical protein